METIRHHLEMQLSLRFHWVERYFPAVAERMSLAYTDIDEMSQEQAQAVTYLLVEKLLFYERASQKARARSVRFEEPKDSNESDDAGPRMALWLCQTALKELCSAYDLESPV